MMTILIFGLILFLGTHSVRIFADPWRSAMIKNVGDGKWKGFYSLISILGFMLIIFGYGQARFENIQIWSPPLWTWHVTALISVIAFVLVSAAYVPNNAIKNTLKDPMILGVKTWAFAHLISNGSLSGILLFGSFLVWSVLDYRTCKNRRGKLAGMTTESSVAMTLITLAIGLGFWTLFALYGHQALIGISPLIRAS